MHQICDGYNPRVRMGILAVTQETGLKNLMLFLNLREQILKNNQEMQK